MQSSSKNEKSLFVLGSLLILTGVICNEWLISAFFRLDGPLDISKRMVIWGLDAFLIGSGLLLIYFRKKIHVISIAVLLVTLTLCLFFAEMGLRFIESKRPEFKIAMENPNGTGSYKLIPNLQFTYPYHGKEVVIKTNSLGMRWKEVTYHNPLKKKRIAFVGDSFTFGESADEIEHSFVGIFDSFMDQEKYEALNFGVVGYGLADIELQIKEDILPFKPDYIILMFFNGNDFRDTYLGSDKFDLSTGLLILDSSVIASKVPETYRNREEAHSFSQRLEVFVKNSSLYKRFNQALWLLESAIGQKEETQLNKGQEGSNFSVSSHFTSFTFWSQKNYPEVAIKAKDQSLEALTNIKRLADDNHIQLLIVSLPFEEQVYSPSLLGKDHSGTSYDVNLPQKYVEEWANANSVPYLDLLPSLRSYVRQNNVVLYPQSDIHFNNEGHLIVGQLVAKFFQEVTGEQILNEPELPITQMNSTEDE